MTVQAGDLLAPAGRLDPEFLWPLVSADDVSTKLDAYLADAETRTADIEDETDRDDARRRWAEYRAYDGVLLEMETSPSSTAFQDEGSGGYSTAQLDLMEKRRDAALAAFEVLIATVDEVEATPPVPRSSVSAPISYRW